MGDFFAANISASLENLKTEPEWKQKLKMHIDRENEQEENKIRYFQQTQQPVFMNFAKKKARIIHVPAEHIFWKKNAIINHKQMLSLIY